MISLICPIDDAAWLSASDKPFLFLLILFPSDIAPDETMIICQTINGEKTELEISLSEWPDYQAQGATEGPCVVGSSVGNDEVEICLNGETKVIKKIMLSKFLLQGATEGPCE